MTSFIHLRVRTAYSLAEGAIALDALKDLCIKHKTPAVAVTDSNNMFGALDFSLEMAGKGIQPIVGTTLHAVVDIAGLEPVPLGERGLPQRRRIVKIPLLVKDETGYRNLLHLVSEAYFDPQGDEPASSLSRVFERNEGLICLSGAREGPVGALLAEGRGKDAELLAERFKTAFGDRFYIELQRYTEADETLVEQSVELALKLDIPLVATNEAFFPDPGFYAAHDALLCIADGAFLMQDDRRRVTPEHYFKSPRSMKELFSDIPDAIENTVHIARRCAYMAEKRKPILPHFPCETGDDEPEELRVQARAGLRERLETQVFASDMPEEERTRLAEEYGKRLEYELDVIIKMKFPGYFLIVSDFIRKGKAEGIPIGPGRGSGAGSMAAWALKITDLDPIRFGLLFERFLNPERVSMPDFDIDFCQERRDEVIKYVQQKYGYRQVAQIITFGKLQARAVIRDVARVMQLPYSMADRISKMIPFNPAKPITLQEAIDQDKALQDMQRDDPDVRQLMSVALKLEGLFRHASTHAAGVIIGDRPLQELAPLYRDPRSDMPVCGFSMKYAEYAGLVKFDFLGLKTLTVIDKAVRMIGLRTQAPDMDALPLDDRPTYKLLSEGDSVGVFQLESAGMRDTLRKLAPDNIDDVIALISLYRPGPMENIPQYIECKHGRKKPDYLHPMLEGLLKETYGVFIYQEQVMQAAQVMGGYTLGGADLLRRAMGKKIASEMEAQRKIFVDGAVGNGVDRQKASSVFDILDKFAGYGFNKSHAAAYALISYQTAYLKANYPVEFLAASINLDIDNTDKIALFLQEAKLHRIPVLPPDVNASFALFTPETDESGVLGVRYGLGGLKNVGAGATERIAEEREKNGRFKDVPDFFARVPAEGLNKRMVENLMKSGALDSLNPDRKGLLAALEGLTRYAACVREERDSAQASLFAAPGGISVPPPAIPKTDGFTFRETAQCEYEATGFFLRNHPLSEYEAALKREGVTFSDGFHALEDKGKAKIAGAVTDKRIRSSPRGRYASIYLSDRAGIFECAIFQEALLDSCRDLLEPGVLLLIDAHVRKEEGAVRLTADAIRLVDENFGRVPKRVTIRAESAAWAEGLKALLPPEEGKDAIYAVLPMEGRRVRVKLGERFSLKNVPAAKLAGLPGVTGTEEAA
jgi:DNA polymerase-3 subunit alpha